MEAHVQEHFNRRSRLSFLLDVTVLGYLCHGDSLSRLETALQTLNPRDQRTFLRGYRLAAATPLNSMLESVASNADLLGLEYDNRLVHWLKFGSRKSGAAILSHISDPDSDLARFCSKIDGLRAELRTSEGGLDQTAEALQRCGDFGSFLRAVLGRCKVASLDSGKEVSNGDSGLRLLIAEHVLGYIWAQSFVDMAYEFVWGGEEESRTPSEYSVLDAQTHLDYVFYPPHSGGMPMRWDYGLLLGLDSVIRMNGVTLASHLKPETESLVGSEWFTELRNFVNPLHPLGSWPSFEYGLAGFDEYSKGELMPLLPKIGYADLANIPAKDRLAGILGPDEVRLFTPGSSTDFMDLEILIAGAISTHVDTPVEMLLATHSVDPDDRDWVSIAVRFRRETFFSNHSRWYLFYKIFHEGFVTDSDVDRARKEVDSLLTRFKDNLIVERIDGISGQDLLSYCELPAFRAMRDLSQGAVDVNSELRAGVTELLASHWLQAQGYSNVKVSLKRASLGDYEYDALGVRDGECLVIEVKSRDVLDKALEQQLVRLGDKIENLRGMLPPLSEELAYNGSIDRVSGLFISLADSRDFEFAVDSVRLWDYNVFVGKLKELGLPTRLYRLLNRSLIIRKRPSFDIFNDPPAIGS